MTIHIPLLERHAPGWKTVNWRFAVTRPPIKREASVRHVKGMPAYTSRRSAADRASRIKWGTFFDVRKVSGERERMTYKSRTRIVISK